MSAPLIDPPSSASPSRGGRASWAALVPFLLLSCDKGPDPAQVAAEQQAKVQQLWGGLARCLLGPPLGEEDKASDRMRRSELTVAVQGDEGDWPNSCQKPLGELLDYLESLGTAPEATRFEALGAALRELNGTGAMMYLAGEEPAVDRLWKAARGLELHNARAEGEGSVAPEAAAPASAGQLIELGTTKGMIERVELAPGATVRVLYGSGEEGAFFCALDSRDGPLTGATCSSPKREVSLVAWPLSSGVDDLSYYWDPKPKSAVWSLDGESVEGPFTDTAYASGKGAFVDVVGGRLGPSLVRTQGSRVTDGSVKGPPGARWLGFRAGVAVWRGPRSGPADTRPIVVYEARGNAPMAAGTKIGPAPRDVEQLDACRAGDTVAIALVGGDPPKSAGDDPERGAAMIFRQGKEWQKVVPATIRLGDKPRPWIERGWRSMTCSEGAATLTWLRSDNAIGTLRCTPEGCQSAQSAPLPIADVDKVRVTSLGAKVLVLRALTAPVPINSLTETITMRLAPAADLAKAAELPIVGDAKHGGLEKLLKGIGLVAVDGAAVALIRSSDKVHGLRIAADGTLGGLTKR